MWLLLAALPFALGMALVRFRTMRTHHLPSLGPALVMGILAVGLMGAGQGEIQGFDAVAHAADPAKQVMLQAVLRISLIPLWTAAGLAVAVAMIFGAISRRTPDVDLPLPKGATPIRRMTQAGSFITAAGVLLFFLQRLPFYTTAIPVEITVISSQVLFLSIIFGLVAFVLSVAAVLGSLVSLRRTPST